MNRRILLPVGIVLFAAAFFAPELFGGKLAVTGNMSRWLPWAETATEEQRAAPSVSMDCNLSYYPRRAVLHQAWRDRVIPYWNPYTFCGTPFLGDIQAGVLYPPNWVLFPLAPGTQLGWFLFLHCAWAGLGAYALARGRSAPPLVAFAAGCAWALNGYLAKHYGQPTFLATAAWMPWVLHLALRVTHRPNLARATVLGLAGAMTFLAGQPQLALFAAYAAVLVAAVAWFSDRRAEEAPAPGRVLLAFLGAGLLAVLLSGAQLLPTRALAATSARADLPYLSVISGALHPAEWIRFLVPEFFGTPLTADEWSTLFPRGDGFYLRNQMNSVFVGTPLFLLSLWGIISVRTWRAALPFTALFAAGILLAFGSPLARLAYEVLPGFRFARIDRAGSLVVLAMIVPATLGAVDLAKARGVGRRVFGALVIVAAAAGLAVVQTRGSELPSLLGADLTHLPGGVLDGERVAHVLGRTWQAAVFAAATGVAFLLPPSWLASRFPVVLACVQLVLFAAPYRMDRDPEEVYSPSPGLDRLQSVLQGEDGGGRFVRFARDMPLHPYPLSSVLPPSTNVPYGLRDLQGYNALTDRKLGEALEAAFGEPVFSHGIWKGRRIVAPEDPKAMEHALLDALSVRASVSGRSYRAAGWVPQPSEGFHLQRNTEALPRVRLAGRGRGVDAEEMERLLREGQLQAAGSVFWIGEGSVDAGLTSPGSVDVLTDGWNDIAVRTRTDRRALLIVADSYSEGWSAALDGNPARILPVYGLVRGVLVPPGEHFVRMTYEPPGFRLGAALSLLGLGLAGTALALARRS